MRLAIDIGFHGRDMIKMVSGAQNANSAVKMTALCAKSVWCGLLNRAEEIGQAENAGKSYQSTDGNAPARRLKIAFHGNSKCDHSFVESRPPTAFWRDVY
jgi:hypothetical protein